MIWAAHERVTIRRAARPNSQEGEMDLTTVDKLLTTTRSVRRRLDLTRPVDPAVIEECLEIAVQAPQGSNNCRYHFLVVTDPVEALRTGGPLSAGVRAVLPGRGHEPADRAAARHGILLRWPSTSRTSRC